MDQEGKPLDTTWRAFFNLQNQVRTQVDIGLLGQSCSKSAVGWSKSVRFYVCSYGSFDKDLHFSLQNISRTTQLYKFPT